LNKTGTIGALAPLDTVFITFETVYDGRVGLFDESRNITPAF
jgi:hypothetical protein